MFKKRMKRITPGQMIILSFATMIFIGACLLLDSDSNWRYGRHYDGHSTLCSWRQENWF